MEFVTSLARTGLRLFTGRSAQHGWRRAVLLFRSQLGTAYKIPGTWPAKAWISSAAPASLAFSPESSMLSMPGATGSLECHLCAAYGLADASGDPLRRVWAARGHVGQWLNSKTFFCLPQMHSFILSFWPPCCAPAHGLDWAHSF